MKKIVIFITAIIISFNALSKKEDLHRPFFEGKEYDIYLSYGNCSQHDIECSDITYHSINKKNKSELNIKGKTLNIGPSKDFRGYIFKNGSYTYTLTPSPEADNYDDSIWFLDVYKTTDNGDKPIFREKGRVSD
ncbi:hypothetical protein [Dickeya solani]|uniref:Uncharacterized protein n=1 Tax=Dickeya solani TaxID=1089444 RepID=A0ABU4EI77_9GAMM|nr:hypothetical protein [Dickeya solani]MCA7000500.1 hypothetical protein [Dickeya solani]MCZ0821188.1 hypothetical protein [Dickeya solani]MDV6995074.1 hypothetical protein [Dickeya solani]MDV7004547.1 hypothetical protein [Dickeya solani]MDV7037658.1 hypothetical protein [Dickeya solani]